MDVARKVPQGVKEGITRFLSDFRDHTVESHGVFYSCHSLLVEARAIEEAGNKACVRFYRDTTGRIDGLELAILKPKKPTLEIVEDGSIEGGASLRRLRGEPHGPGGESPSVACTTIPDSSRTPSDLDSQPPYCQCGHPEGEHYQGSVCEKIEGMYVCGCEKFIPELDAESYRKSLGAREAISL